ncbi:hypothetical protein FG475_14945 [Vibrio navarrensis]|uniref:hypothetical protein n=1 Tax=Vibrio navarrensis TaxID=29495 RepID=UPI0018DE3BC9|nr:hypothetical protein [Vibrio navarrensis]EHA1126417.1 hypothetical protein [Vibrio navarrensis]MBH9739986.1 hypothetical protein [Vibrio navarrensis]HDY8121327.1 hypothetical protein [Vibrio vulnificus]
MPNVVINGVEYVPKADIPELSDERLKKCLMVLTEMRYFNEEHKMKQLAWNAINALSPELANLDESTAYDRIHDKDDQGGVMTIHYGNAPLSDL